MRQPSGASIPETRGIAGITSAGIVDDPGSAFSGGSGTKALGRFFGPPAAGGGARPSGDNAPVMRLGSKEFRNRRQDLRAPFRMRIMPRSLDDLQLRCRDAGRELALMLWREDEVCTPLQHQGGNRDLAEAVHDRPALHELLSAEDQRLLRKPGPPIPLPARSSYATWTAAGASSGRSSSA